MQIPLVQHPESVVLVVVEGDELVCVRQRRPGAPEPTLELPSGKIEAGETPEEAARRELREECGLAAGSLRPLGTFWIVPSYSTERAHVFHVTSFWQGPPASPDDDEDIEVVHVRVADAWTTLSDAASLGALARWRETT